MSNVFSKVAGLKPGLTSFNLQHSNLLDMEFGKLYPVDCIECLPGDIWNMNNLSTVGRLTSALKAPMLTDIDLVVEAFFVPCRLLMGSDANFDTPAGERNFEEVLVGGKDGNEVLSIPTFRYPGSKTCVVAGSFFDYLGVQIGVNHSCLSALPHRAYRWIWNEYYRFEQLEDEIEVCNPYYNSVVDFSLLDKFSALLYRGWRRDYFTSALPYQQFGTSPAFQLSGTLPVDVKTDIYDGLLELKEPHYNIFSVPSSVTSGSYNVVTGVSNSDNSNASLYADVNGQRYMLDKISGHIGDLTSLSVNLQNAVTFDVSDVRTAFQIQKWLERNARGGIRYTEYLQSHFGVSPSDARLQRPEFIGSFRAPWLVSEVLQSSETTDTSVQGNQAGQAMLLNRGSLGRYKCYEFGYIMILASIVPKPAYQQGLSRMWTRLDKLDWYSPEFAHLSEQAILNKELFVSGDEDKDDGIFGFQGIWNEYRYIPNKVTGHMRSNSSGYSFDYWHQARFFKKTPKLNVDFLHIGSTASSMAELNRVFAVQDESPFIVNFGFNFKAMRPLPYVSEPGLVDHF